MFDAVQLPGHPGGHDVGVITIGDRGEGVGLIDTRLLQSVSVETHSFNLTAVELGGKTAERIGQLVDDGHGMTHAVELSGHGGSHAAAAHNDEVHGKTVLLTLDTAERGRTIRCRA